jgi:alkylhydroperoxidase family enzyme
VARLPLVDPDDPGLDPYVRARIDEIREGTAARGLGESVVLNATRALAYHPPALRAIFELRQAGYAGTSLSPQQRELAYLSSSVANDCFY